MRRWLWGFAIALSSCHRADHSKQTPAPDASSSQKPSSIAPPQAPPEPRQGMVWVPDGALVAGTPADAFPRLADEEIRGEQFILGGFYIDEFPYPDEEGAIPLTNVSQEEASTLCGERQKRLCTELEWERACKGPSNFQYEYGEHFRAEACATGADSVLRPNGLHAGCRSDFGVHDLHGGAWEWTSSAWTRRGATGLVTQRGGNGVHGELVGRCANGQGKAPNLRAGNIGFRCCAGKKNSAEVVLNVVHARKLELRGSVDQKLAGQLLDLLPEAGRQELGGRGEPVIDRIWSWWPAGNDELVVASVCAGVGRQPACGIVVGRQTPGRLMLLEWIASGFWPPALHPEFDPRDIWLVGGDEIAPFKKLISYVWGKLRVGPKERRLPKPPSKKR